MLNEIIKKYSDFPDALIVGFQYNSIPGRYFKGTVDLTVRCMNHDNDDKYELIKLTFTDVISFRFMNNESTTSEVIFAALLKEHNDIITFDFFPLMYSNDGMRLEENPVSDLVIKCKSVTRELIKTL